MNRFSDTGEQTLALDYMGAIREAIKSFGLVLGFTVITALAAQLYLPLPFTPVPLTLQTLAVLLSGALIGPWRGGVSQFLYVLWGVLGLPFFAGATTGFAILAGPSGGYILGFILAALYVGAVIRGAQGVTGVATVFTFGTAIILFAGWAHMTLFYTDLNMTRAFQMGVVPFLPGAVIKIVIATGIYAGIESLKRSRKHASWNR